MSMHTQLLRGVVALPLLVLLAVASVTAPALAPKTHAEAREHARGGTIVVVADDGVVLVRSAPR